MPELRGALIEVCVSRLYASLALWHASRTSGAAVKVAQKRPEKPLKYLGKLLLTRSKELKKEAKERHASFCCVHSFHPGHGLP
jgi:hypothetical protein